MNHEQDVIYRINTNFKKLSKGQKLIAEYMLNNYDKAAFLTASKLGNIVKVSESTVVRFANALGYDGYPKLQKALQELIRNKLTTIQRIELSSDLEQSMILKSVLKADLNNIRLTIEEANNEVFERVIDSIFKAKNIYILGIRSSAPLAQIMGYYLNFIFSNVKIVTSGVSDIFEQIIHIDSDDLLIGISFPRYSNRTIEAMSFCKEKGAEIVALTDSLLSPLTTFAEHTLLARSDMASFADSLVAPLSLINAIIVAISLRKKTDLSVQFTTLEKIWHEYHVYISKDEL